METNRYNFSSLPNKLLGFQDSYLHECYVGKNFDSVNVGDVIEYNGVPTWSKWQEWEIERRMTALNCECKTFSQGNRVFMTFIKK